MFKTFLKFMAVGTLNAVIYFSLMYLLTSIVGIWYMSSAVISVIVQTLLTFGLHRIWTWGKKKTSINSITNIYRLIKYGIVGVCGAIFGLGLLYAITEYIHLYYMVSVFIASCILLVCNFLANNYWTWGNNETRELRWIANVIERLGFVPIIKRMGVQI